MRPIAVLVAFLAGTIVGTVVPAGVSWLAAQERGAPEGREAESDATKLRGGLDDVKAHATAYADIVRRSKVVARAYHDPSGDALRVVLGVLAVRGRPVPRTAIEIELAESAAKCPPDAQERLIAAATELEARRWRVLCEMADRENAIIESRAPSGPGAAGAVEPRTVFAWVTQNSVHVLRERDDPGYDELRARLAAIDAERRELVQGVLRGLEAGR